METPWKNRIIGSGVEEPAQLLANPENFRAHPSAQRNALAAVLAEVGFVAPVIVNRTTGHLIDGHLRVELALARDEQEIPVSYVELSQDEERLVLATFDPLGDLAFPDKDRLRELLEGVSSPDATIQALLANVATEAGLAAASGSSDLSTPRSVKCPSCGDEFVPKR
jgi:hypothetical protein